MLLKPIKKETYDIKIGRTYRSKNRKLRGNARDVRRVANEVYDKGLKRRQDQSEKLKKEE